MERRRGEYARLPAGARLLAGSTDLQHQTYSSRPLNGQSRGRSESTLGSQPKIQTGSSRPSNRQLSLPGETNIAPTASHNRSLKRLKKLNSVDEAVIGKYNPKLYLPDNLASVFDPPIEAPDDDNFTPPPWLAKGIFEVFESSVPTPEAPPFKFGDANADEEFNSKLLREVKYVLDTIMDEHQHTSLKYGAEFRPLAQLRKIFRFHPLLSFFTGLYKRGMDYD